MAEDMGVDGASRDDVASEVQRLWSEVYRLWEASRATDGLPENNCKNSIDVLSRLLDLIDVDSHPHEYCVALRIRAQKYCVLRDYERALQDLHREQDVNYRVNDQIRAARCEDLIAQIKEGEVGDKGMFIVAISGKFRI